MLFISNKRGFSVLETLIVFAVIAILTAFGVNTFLDSKDNKALNQNVLLTESILNGVRTKSVSGQGDDVHGLHLESDSIIEFTGSTYDPNDPENTEYIFDSNVELSGISLNGSSTDIVFNRLTGATSDYGTLTFSLIEDPTVERTITITATGIISTDN